MHTPNAIIRQIDVPSVVGSFYNSGGIIRTPMVVLESTLTGSDYLKVIHDKYTHIDAVDLVYCRQPYRFNILNYNDKDDSKGAVHSYCELPFVFLGISGRCRTNVHYKLQICIIIETKI